MDLTNIIIETDRLILVPITMDYKHKIFREFQPPVTEFMHPKPPEKIEETEEFINRMLKGLSKGSDLAMVVLNKVTNEFLGCAGLHDLDTEGPELGVWIKSKAHGHKYGREAITALKEWADANVMYDYIRYPVAVQNIPSRKIPESLGGIINKEYDSTNLAGVTHRMVEYRIPGKE